MRRHFCCFLILLSSLLLFSCNQDSQSAGAEQTAITQTDDSHNSRRDLKMLAFIGIMLMYLIPLTWMIERLVKHKNSKIKDLNAANTELEKQSNSLLEAIASEQSHNSKLNKELRKIKSDYVELQHIKKSEEKALQQILKRIDSYSSKLYLSPKVSEGINLRSEKFLDEIDDMINGYAKGFIESVKECFPKMKPDRLRLVRYLYAGFSTETMMYLFSYESRAKLDNSKWLLKKTILENTNWPSLSAPIMLKKLHYKTQS